MCAIANRIFVPSCFAWAWVATGLVVGVACSETDGGVTHEDDSVPAATDALAGVDGDATETTDGVARIPEAILRDEHGTAIRPDRLLVAFDDGISRTDAEGVIAAAGATLDTWLLGGAVVSYPLGVVPLDTMRAFEASFEVEAAVDYVVRDTLFDVGRSDDDYTSLPAADAANYRRVRTDEAKHLFESCTWQMGADDLERELVICVVDNDLLGVKDGLEYTGRVRSFADHHTHATREFCGTSAGGFQIPCEPSTELMHGSAVSSVMVARDDGLGANGLLAGFSGNGPGAFGSYAIETHLRLFNVGHGARASAIDLLAALEAAGGADCAVVNVSMGTNLGPGYESRPEESSKRSFEAVLDGFPNKLFVMAAGNDDVDLSRVVHWSTLRRDNLLVVGSTRADDTKAATSNFGTGQIDLAAPGDAIHLHGIDVRHSGTTAFPEVETRIVDNVGRHFSLGGTSFASPLVAAAAGWLRAFEPLSRPAGIKSWLRRVSDDIAVLEGKRLNFKKLVADILASRINSAATHLLELNGPIALSGDIECAALEVEFGHTCLPVVVSGGAISAVANARDINGNPYTLTGTLTTTAFDFTISGMGITPGVGPAATRLSGSVTTSALDVNDYVLGGAIAGDSRKPDGAPLNCAWTGTMTGRVHARTP